MTGTGRMDRRAALRLIGSLPVGLAASGLMSACRLAPSTSGGAVMAEQVDQTATPIGDLELTLRAEPGEVQALSGAATRVLRYTATMHQGQPGQVTEIPGSYLGPIIRARRGQRVRVHFENRIHEPTIVHWHGLHVPEHSDGHPRLAIEPGESYDYDLTVIDRAGTYWYHPHPHGRTGPQVYAGLAGLFIVEDDEERALGLPSGQRDIPLVIQDRTFDDENGLHYLGRGMMDAMLGFLGNRVLVNGRPDYQLQLASEPHRLRILNGSNSRVYKLAWDDGAALTVIGTDGGLLGAPIQRSYITLGPGERTELWLDLSAEAVGATRRLVSLPFDGEMTGGMMGMRIEASLPQGARLEVLSLEVTREGAHREVLPERLCEPPQLEAREAVNRLQPRRIELEMQRMAWLLNGRAFEMDGVARDEIVRLGDAEIWEFVNQNPMMGMIHPMHVHNVQFRVISREVAREYRAAWETVSEGYLDEGWKDTVLLMPGERVKVLMRFSHYPGLYLYHCHNLEHEDSGMMRNYRIEA